MKILFFANTDWYLYNFRLPLARFLRGRGFEMVLVSPDGPFASRIRAEGFRFLPVPMQRRSLNPFRELSLLLHLARLYRSEKPGLVHHFTIKCVVYGSLAARLAGVRARVNAVTGLGYVFTSADPLARLLRPFVLRLLRFALGGDQSRLILQNSDDRDAFISARLVDPSRIRLIRGSGVNTEKFRPVPHPRQSSGPVRVLMVGRILRDKGAPEFVKAAEILKREGLNIEFLLAGTPDPGNPASIPVAEIERWRTEKAVILLDHVEDMPACLARIDIVALPSHREGLPRTLIEAASAGLPIVATDAPGCREIVKHCVNGLLVPVGDARTLAAAIRRLCTNRNEASKMGKAGRDRVLVGFDEQIIFQETGLVYEEILPPRILA